MKAYDNEGNLLDSVVVITPGTQAANVGFTLPGIHRITMETDTDGTILDNFSFSPPTPLFTEISIDIKPDSPNNKVNLKSAGVVPVAIFSTPEFNVANIDPDSITMGGSSVRRVGKSDRVVCNIEYINNDDLNDLMCHIEISDMVFDPGLNTAVLQALSFDGVALKGEDLINIKQ